MRQPRLENWFVGHNDQIFGEVYDDPRFEDGTAIITTRVVTLDLESGVARTKNSNYILGTPGAPIIPDGKGRPQ